MTHSPHDDIHEVGLDAACPRCDELANHPDQLDEDNQSRLRAGFVYTGLDRVAAANLARLDERKASA